MDTFFADKSRWTYTEVAKMLVSHNALTAITEENALKLVRRMWPYRVKSGTVLFREGEKDSKVMIFILQGEAIVESSAAGHGDSMVIKLLGEGDLIGELGIVDSRARSATVTAVSEMALAALDQASFKVMIREDAELACTLLGSMLKSVSMRLRESNRKLHTMGQINKSLVTELEASQAREQTLDKIVGSTHAQLAHASKRPARTPKKELTAEQKRLPETVQREAGDTHVNGMPPDFNVDLNSRMDMDVSLGASGAAQAPQLPQTIRTAD